MTSYLRLAFLCVLVSVRVETCTQGVALVIGASTYAFEYIHRLTGSNPILVVDASDRLTENEFNRVIILLLQRVVGLRATEKVNGSRYGPSQSQAHQMHRFDDCNARESVGISVKGSCGCVRACVTSFRSTQ